MRRMSRAGDPCLSKRAMSRTWSCRTLVAPSADHLADHPHERPMHPLTEKQIRSSFVNASKREAADATLPDLDAVAWDRLDYLGWRDRRAPLSAYVVVPGPDDELTGVLLRASEKGGRRKKAVCQWCADVVATDDVTLYVARRAGASGKNGNTIGTLICTDFVCSQNVRRPPTRAGACHALGAFFAIACGKRSMPSRHPLVRRLRSPEVR